MRIGGGAAQGRGRRRPAALLLVTMLGIAVAGCGDIKEQSLCPVYEDWLDVKVDIAELDPTTATAAQAADQVERALDVTHRLQDVEPDRYTQAVNDLEENLQDLQDTLSSIPDDADYSTWAPLVEDSVEAATKAADHVQTLIDPTCRPDAD